MSSGAVRAIFSIIAHIAACASAQPAGPPAPPPVTRTPAEIAITLNAAARTGYCAPTRGGDIVVCGNGRSPDRLPLPEERGARAGPRTATGEPPHMGVGGGPFARLPGGGIGLTLTVKGSDTAVAGNGGPSAP